MAGHKCRQGIVGERRISDIDGYSICGEGSSQFLDAPDMEADRCGSDPENTRGGSRKVWWRRSGRWGRRVGAKAKKIAKKYISEHELRETNYSLTGSRTPVSRALSNDKRKS